MKLIGDRWPAALFGLLVVAPWNLFMAFGFTFTFRAHESFFAWMFVWVTFLLSAPASVLALKWPRIGGGWMLANACVSILMAVIFLAKSAMEPNAGRFELSMLPGMLFTATIFWLPNIFVGTALSWPRESPAGAKAQA